ncbi:prepilin peptidase [Bacillus ndiopicus]|uniref:prepilin peptidase n=1 Tax=Bacillus ndiopicus TaxID=1347368 RepID=UPI0005A97198|nr:A24 family peptidase [Bacillus ndiopicus]
MTVTYTFLSLILGLVLGSFYNVVGLRIPKNESIVYPGSHCTNCHRSLNAVDLVPVFSYLLLHGKCRLCKVRISPIYMVMELLTGICFAFSYWQLGISLELIVAWLFISLLIIITVSDIAYMLIPNKILLFFLPLIALGRILSPLEPWWDSLLGAAIGFGTLLLIAVVSRGGMGGGDIKLFFIIGLVLGTINTLLTLFLAAVIGMFASVIILKKHNQSRKTPIPFGPSIALAAIIVYFFGNKIMEWYKNLFF